MNSQPVNPEWVQRILDEHQSEDPRTDDAQLEEAIDRMRQLLDDEFFVQNFQYHSSTFPNDTPTPNIQAVTYHITFVKQLRIG